MRAAVRAAAALFVLIFSMEAHGQTAAAPSLSTADVDQIVGQALAEANARNAGNGVISVVDRLGNVLGVYAVNPATIPTMTVGSGRGIPAGNGLEDVVLPATYGAIAKAITGAYLSSSGNAFSTRTASQIVQDHFNPGEKGQPSGPLFGVQFSQLACSDLMRGGEALGNGPRRSPLGLSADPGGLPLYKDGQVVGGVGVMFDGVYGLDLNITDYDRNIDEIIAVAAQRSFTPPRDITERITADGKFLHFADVDLRDVQTSTAAAVNPANYVAVPGYAPAFRRAGLAYGSTSSGVRDDGDTQFPGVDAWVLDDGMGSNRYAPRASFAPAVAAGGMAREEVRTLLTEALKVAFRARAQIRRPLGSYAQVSVSVVDAEANILALARTPDAPVFGTDVSLQKARSVLFFSRSTSFAEMAAIPSLASYATTLRTFLGPTALGDGVAYGARTIGLLARPFYPDGLDGRAPGPLSKPFAVWSPFNTGLQLDLVAGDIVARLDGSLTPPQGCTALPQSQAAGPGPTPTRLANGLQIFPGGMPIFRGATLVGAIGISGDGVDQDDMIAFLGLHNAGLVLNSGLGHAPTDRRADHVTAGDLNLRYVQCPFTPFNQSREQNVCAAK